MSRRFIMNLIWVLVLISVGGSVSADDDAENKNFGAPKTETKRPTDYEALIDSLADRINKVPVIVKVPGETVPVFLETYDPREQARIRDVVRSLVHYPGNELWPHLQPHFNDRRYALTYSAEPTALSFNANNETVGNICSLVISQLIDYPCNKHLPKRSGKKDKKARGIPEFPFPKNMKTWGTKDKNGRLDEVQTEVCQFVLDHPDQITGMSDDEREKFLDGVRAELETLRRTKVALMPAKLDYRRILFGSQEVDHFRERYGDQARQQIEENQKAKWIP